MDNEFDLGLDRKSLSIKAPSAINVLMIVVVLIAAIVSLGELTFTVKGAINVTLTVIVLYIVASIVYPNSYSAAMAKEKLTPEYTAAKEEYENSIREVGALKMLTEMPDYCVRYSREELKACRSAILLDECIEYDTFESKYLGKSRKELRKENLSYAAVKCIRDASRVKAINITPGNLLGSGEEVTLAQRVLRIVGARRSVGIESRTRQRLDNGMNMLTRAITTILAGAIGVTVVIEEFSLRTIAEWAMKMLPIVIAALGGNIAGKHNVSGTLIPQMQRKTKIIQTMIGWHQAEGKALQLAPEGEQKEPSVLSENT